MGTLKITVLLSERVLETRTFSGGNVRVGRNPGCELTIDNLGVSRVHCELQDAGGGAYLLRDRSGGRTFLNGAAVVEHDLADGDLIRLGKFTLAVSLGQTFATRGGEGGVGAATLGGVEDTGRETSTARPLARLLEEGTPGLLLERLHTSVGGGEDCQVRLSGWRQPRVAVVFVREEGGYRVLDTSPDGDSLQVAGQRCRSAQLGDGDRVEVRGRAFEFRYEQAGGA